MKVDFDRRQFIGHSAAAFSVAALPRCLLAATATATATTTSTVPPAPVARIDVAHDTYFGETLSDPYRWMENDKDPEWLPFLKGQNEHARAVLDGLPARDKLLKRIRELSGGAAATSRVQSRAA
jgi:prolyl oligopeptidase